MAPRSKRLAPLPRTKPSGWETLLRPMDADELEDFRRGWAASALRRRAAGLGLRAADLDAPEAEDRCELEAA